MMRIEFGKDRPPNVALMLDLLVKGAPEEMRQRARDLAKRHARGEDVSMEVAAMAAEFEKWQKTFKPPDKWIIEHPERWHHKNVLIMFKPHPTGVVQMGESGFILCDYAGWPREQALRTVWVGVSAFDCSTWRVNDPRWQKVRGRKYKSIDSMLADGWEVDT